MDSLWWSAFATYVQGLISDIGDLILDLTQFWDWFQTF